jgi:hypothetical protein
MQRRADGPERYPDTLEKVKHYIMVSSRLGKTKENGKAWTNRISNRDAGRRSRKI